MNFFLDTGIFLGLCDHKDNWHNCCNNFSLEYQLQNRDYYTTDKVKEELVEKMKKRRRAGERGGSLRFVEQSLKTWLMNSKFVNYINHPDYTLVIHSIGSIITKDPDITIVSNAIIWSYDLNLNQPVLVTVDTKHMVRNESKFKTDVKLAINKDIPLTIMHAKQL